MSESTVPAPSPSVMNFPNQVTIARIVLAIVMFGFLIGGYYLVSLAMFVVAAASDWVDGYWARKYGQITQLGRVLDPFADKLLICGTFIVLAAVPPLADGTLPSGIAAWMTLVVVARELLVTTLRTFVEQQGGDFSAKWVGKWKMGLQCLVAGGSMVHLSYVDQANSTWATEPPQWMSQGLTIAAWAMVFFTAYSGVAYVRSAIAKFS